MTDQLMELLLNHRKLGRFGYFFPRKRRIVLSWHFPWQELRQLYMWIYFFTFRSNPVLLWLLKFMLGLLLQLCIRSQTNTVTGFLRDNALFSICVFCNQMYIDRKIVWECGKELPFHESMASRHPTSISRLSHSCSWLYCIFLFVALTVLLITVVPGSSSQCYFLKSGYGGSQPEEFTPRMCKIRGK